MEFGFVTFLEDMLDRRLHYLVRNRGKVAEVVGANEERLQLCSIEVLEKLGRFRPSVLILGVEFGDDPADVADLIIRFLASRQVQPSCFGLTKRASDMHMLSTQFYTYQECQKLIPFDGPRAIGLHLPETILCQVTLDMKEGFPLVAVNSSFIVQLVSVGSQTHAIIWGTFGLQSDWCLLSITVPVV